METKVYVIAFAYGLGIWLVAALPLVVSTIVVLIQKNRIKNKWWFVVFSGVTTYGVAATIYVLFVPIYLIDKYLGPQWDYQGYQLLAKTFSILSEAGPILSLAVVLVGSFVVPVFTYRNYWDHITKIIRKSHTE